MDWQNFNPHFRKGSDEVHMENVPCTEEFQSTLPQGKWPCEAFPHVRQSRFQSTLPQGKWHNYLHTPTILTIISIHTSAREVTMPERCYDGVTWISIHTSAREVTNATRSELGGTYISIHTSAREVTCFRYSRRNCRRFQSTLPQGKWPNMESRLYSGLSISIHTSAREVTKIIIKTNGVKAISIHTSAREVTKLLWQRFKWWRHFNPHFRKGSDFDGSNLYYVVTNFNPHFRKGSDKVTGDYNQDVGISIHTSAREVTIAIDSPF